MREGFFLWHFPRSPPLHGMAAPAASWGLAGWLSGEAAASSTGLTTDDSVGAAGVPEGSAGGDGLHAKSRRTLRTLRKHFGGGGQARAKKPWACSLSVLLSSN